MQQGSLVRFLGELSGNDTGWVWIVAGHDASITRPSAQAGFKNDLDSVPLLEYKT
jgi:hypothetical protein